MFLTYERHCGALAVNIALFSKFFQTVRIQEWARLRYETSERKSKRTLRLHAWLLHKRVFTFAEGFRRERGEHRGRCSGALREVCP